MAGAFELTRLRNGLPTDKLVDGFLSLADEWIARATDPAGYAWFQDTIKVVVAAQTERALAVAIGMAPRRLGKDDLLLAPDDKARAAALRPGLDPSGWSVDQLARIALMITSYKGDDADFAARFDRFCASAELRELIALCRGLPLYPRADLIEPRAREAVRSGMKPVFEAVAHRNPYPREVFAQEAWNHMVVKAFFIESPLWPIQGLDERANSQLARMLVDLAQERWSAGRAVSPEVWRCVAPHADEKGITALKKAFEQGAERERLGVVLALQQCDRESGDLLGADMLDLQARIAREGIGWEDLARM